MYLVDITIKTWDDESHYFCICKDIKECNKVVEQNATQFNGIIEKSNIGKYIVHHDGTNSFVVYKISSKHEDFVEKYVEYLDEDCMLHPMDYAELVEEAAKVVDDEWYCSADEIITEALKEVRCVIALPK